MTGSAALDLYNPRQFVERGEVIVVAMQYRVGSHGFLYFGENSGVPGNAGLLDQVMALRWIQDNIADFGGDPGDVTLMGRVPGLAAWPCTWCHRSPANCSTRRFSSRQD